MTYWASKSISKDVDSDENDIVMNFHIDWTCKLPIPYGRMENRITMPR